MSDYIDELVDWQLQNTKPSNWLGTCPHCGGPWHGFRNSYCEGSQKRYSKELVRHADHIAWMTRYGM